jgi:uncharacterized protein YaaR (DUF327 family)
MINVNYVTFCIKQIEEKITELYEAMMDEDKEEILTVIKDIKKLCSDIAEDQKD